MTPTNEFLFSLLARLRALALFYEEAHWLASPNYADHLLLGRLYDTTEADIDPLAERLVGLGGSLAGQVAMVASLFPNQTDTPFPTALRQEAAILRLIQDNQTACSPGTQNLVQGIADRHEGAVYLLRQRLATQQPAPRAPILNSMVEDDF